MARWRQAIELAMRRLWTTRLLARHARENAPAAGHEWLADLVQGTVLRHIRVASKHELKERIMAGIDDVNHHPVIHTWSYRLARPPDMIRTKETLT
jgi:hypothetical protein